MCKILKLKFSQNSLVVRFPYLLTYSQQCFVTTLLRHIVFMRNVFCFNGFNQTAIVLRVSETFSYVHSAVFLLLYVCIVLYARDFYYRYLHEAITMCALQEKLPSLQECDIRYTDAW